MSTAKDNELWVLLLEKAWAKVHGDYCRIVGGLCHETFRDMTGAPGYMYKSNDEDPIELWTKMEKADKRNHLLAAGISGKNVKELEAEGLIVGHAYSVIAVATVYSNEGKKTNIVQVRNPWGSFEWNGKWSDTDTTWTDKAKKKVKLVVDKEDGTFWMSFEDFKSRFSLVFISPYEDDYKFDYEMVPTPVKQDGNYLF